MPRRHLGHSTYDFSFPSICDLLRLYKPDVSFLYTYLRPFHGQRISRWLHLPHKLLCPLRLDMFPQGQQMFLLQDFPCRHRHLPWAIPIISQAKSYRQLTAPYRLRTVVAFQRCSLEVVIGATTWHSPGTSAQPKVLMPSSNSWRRQAPRPMAFA